MSRKLFIEKDIVILVSIPMKNAPVKIDSYTDGFKAYFMIEYPAGNSSTRIIT